MEARVAHAHRSEGAAEGEPVGRAAAEHAEVDRTGFAFRLRCTGPARRRRKRVDAEAEGGEPESGRADGEAEADVVDVAIGAEAIEEGAALIIGERLGISADTRSVRVARVSVEVDDV